MDMERRLSEVMGEFARTVVTDFSVRTILDQLVGRIVHVLPISGAGVTLLAVGAKPHYVAASDAQALHFESLQSRLESGPCWTAYETGEAVAVADLRTDEQFPGFAEHAVAAGLLAVFAFPLRHGDTRFGALDLFRLTAGPLDRTAMVAAQTLADVAAAYLLVAQARDDLEAASARELVSLAHDEQAVRTLRASEERKRAILASALDPVVTIDGAGRIVELNAAAERTFGHSAALADGLSLAELVTPPEEVGDHWRGLDVFLAGSDETVGGRRIELTATRADGSRFPVEMSISAVRGIGPSYFTAFIRDLTGRNEREVERQRLARRVQQTERLESLGQLAGGIAHDFNNLLTIVLNYGIVIAEAPTSDAETVTYANVIVSTAERAARLTRQLLMFARREPVQRSPLDVNAVVADIQDLLERTIGSNIDLVVRCAPDLPPIDGDRGQTEQVLVNLAVNARDAMPGGGTLTIETRLDDQAVCLSVSDTGVGMTPEVAAHAFNPFFTTKGMGKGSGLGLATVYGIVIDAGGTVELETDEGSGTTVTARFPLVPPVAPASAA